MARQEMKEATLGPDYEGTREILLYSIPEGTIQGFNVQSDNKPVGCGMEKGLNKSKERSTG